MVPLTIQEFMAHWGITGRATKITTTYEGKKKGEATWRQGTFELMLDGVVYKAVASWKSTDPEPDVPSILNDLRSMSLSCDNAADFDAWAKDLGYDNDSRAAENSYYARCTETRKLERWLGLGRFRMLLWETKGL
jgi:hypothetical protein